MRAKPPFSLLWPREKMRDSALSSRSPAVMRPSNASCTISVLTSMSRRSSAFSFTIFA